MALLHHLSSLVRMYFLISNFSFSSSSTLRMRLDFTVMFYSTAHTTVTAKILIRVILSPDGDLWVLLDLIFHMPCAIYSSGVHCENTSQQWSVVKQLLLANRHWWEVHSHPVNNCIQVSFRLQLDQIKASWQVTWSQCQ